MSAATVYVNARFLAEPLTGVQRFGREILRELDGMLEEGEIDREAFRFELLTRDAPQPAAEYRHLHIRRCGVLRSHFWEQLGPPSRARGFLLNLKNTAPVRHPHMGVVIHDLQVFANPETHTGLFGALYRWVLPRAAARARVLYAPSQSTAREIQRHLGIPAERVRVTSEGHEHILRTEPDPSILEKFWIEPGSYLLAVSSLNPNKNFAAILGALSRAGLEGTPCVIAGGANPRVFAGSKDAQLPKGAKHVGRVSDGQLRALYENAMGFVFPSRYEGFGLPPLEAMALGCPVVCSSTTSMPEVGGEAVLYCDPDDVEDLARQLQRLVEDAGLRGELAAKGRARAAGFTWRAAARKIWAPLACSLAEDSE